MPSQQIASAYDQTSVSSHSGATGVGIMVMLGSQGTILRTRATAFIAKRLGMLFLSHKLNPYPYTTGY